MSICRTEEMAQTTPTLTLHQTYITYQSSSVNIIMLWTDDLGRFSVLRREELLSIHSVSTSPFAKNRQKVNTRQSQKRNHNFATTQAHNSIHRWFCEPQSDARANSREIPCQKRASHQQSKLLAVIPSASAYSSGAPIQRETHSTLNPGISMAINGSLLEVICTIHFSRS
jgi:hypothetical protein